MAMRQNVRMRRRLSDAKWRRSMSSCYDTLRWTAVLGRRRGTKKVSKAIVLEEAKKHIQYLEGVVSTLLQEKEKRNDDNSSYSLKSLDDIKQAFCEPDFGLPQANVNPPESKTFLVDNVFVEEQTVPYGESLLAKSPSKASVDATVPCLSTIVASQMGIHSNEQIPASKDVKPKKKISKVKVKRKSKKIVKTYKKRNKMAKVETETSSLREPDVFHQPIPCTTYQVNRCEVPFTPIHLLNLCDLSPKIPSDIELYCKEELQDFEWEDAQTDMYKAVTPKKMVTKVKIHKKSKRTDRGPYFKKFCSSANKENIEYTKVKRLDVSPTTPSCRKNLESSFCKDVPGPISQQLSLSPNYIPVGYIPGYEGPHAKSAPSPEQDFDGFFVFYKQVVSQLEKYISYDDIHSEKMSSIIADMWRNMSESSRRTMAAIALIEDSDNSNDSQLSADLIDIPLAFVDDNSAIVNYAMQAMFMLSKEDVIPNTSPTASNPLSRSMSRSSFGFSLENEQCVPCLPLQSCGNEVNKAFREEKSPVDDLIDEYFGQTDDISPTLDLNQYYNQNVFIPVAPHTPPSVEKKSPMLSQVLVPQIDRSCLLQQNMCDTIQLETSFEQTVPVAHLFEPLSAEEGIELSSPPVSQATSVDSTPPPSDDEATVPSCWIHKPKHAEE